MADETKDPPIEPLNYLSGITVVDIGDLRIARGMSRRPHSSCQHPQLHYDNHERRIWCKDCERNIEPFDAFRMLVDRYGAALDNIKRREQALREAEAFKVRTIAAKKMDEAWRHRDMVPSCPYCHNGLLPEDFKAGISMIDKEFARLRRAHKKD